MNSRNYFPIRKQPRIHGNHFHVFIVVVIYYLAALPSILSDFDVGRAYRDQIAFHLPTIIQFSENWNIGNYSSATTPLYHLILGKSMSFFSLGEVGLKLLSSLWTALLLGSLTHAISKTMGKNSVILMLPMVFSLYILPAGIWLLPDNMAWLTVTLLMTYSLKLRQINLKSGAMLATAFLVRQSNLWLIIPVIVADFTRYKTEKPAKILYRSLIYIGPVFCLLIVFYLLWGGLTPPKFINNHVRPNFSVPVFILCVFGFYALFYSAYLMEYFQVKLQEKKFKKDLAKIALAGFVFSILPETDWNQEAGRISGLWNIAKITPEYFHRSPFVIVMATFGITSLYILLTSIKIKQRLILLASFITFSFSQIVNHFSYEKYYAGFVFIFVLLSLSCSQAINWRHIQNWKHIGPILFTVFNLYVLTRALT